MTDDENIDLPDLDPDRNKSWKPYGQVWDKYPKSHRKRIQLKDKKHIRCLFISKWFDNKCTYDYGLLTDDFQFFHCKVCTRYDSITTDLWLKMRHMFMPFVLTKTTDVMMTDNISCYEPIAYYLKILQEQLFFNMRSVSRKQVMKRIETFHPYYVKHKLAKATIKDMPILWEKIIQNRKCPWINEEIDSWLKDATKRLRERHQFLRLALYYMLVKQHLYNVFKNTPSGQKRAKSTT